MGTHVHRVAVDILRRGVEPPRHPQQAVDATVPLLDLGLAEPPTRDPWRRGWLAMFRCGCLCQIRSDGSTLLRVTCAAHRPVGVSTAWTCRCGATGNPAGYRCARCGERA